MQSDIVPPPRRPNTKSARQLMKSARLRGHKLDDARRRLLGYRNNLQGLHLPSLEVEAVNRKPLPIGGRSSKPARQIHFWQRLSGRQKLAILFSFIVLSGGLAAGLSIALKEPVRQIEKSPLKVEAEPPPKPTTVASPLTGIQVAPEVAARPATAIMIENSMDARPQSSLHEAGVVFEAIAEGGITRFLALYQETNPQYIGPVRSLRPYYIDLAAPFDAGIAHVGGSPEALAQIRGGGKDLDQFFNAGAYWRIPSRRAPHNMYTSFERLDALNKAKGYTNSKYTSWPRKEDKPLPAPNAKSINVAISSVNYNSRYDYDPATNSYLRSQAGRPHISTSSEADGAGQQLRPKNVVVLVVPYSLSGKYSVYGVNGSGTAFIFQDGGVTQANWSKAGRAEQFSFTDAAGQPVALNAGQTWVALVAAANRVTFTP